MAASTGDSERHQAQIARVLSESETPDDRTQELPLHADPPPDRTRQFRHTNFSRMRTEWGADDKVQIEDIHHLARQVLEARFAVAYDVLDRLWLCVRSPRIGPGGELVPGANGRPQWETHPNGSPVEDWSQLTDRQREDFIFEITTHLFEWEQESSILWTEAMYAKVRWEQAFASGYTAPTGRYTIDDRTQMGHMGSANERYFGIFEAALSRRAEALVRSMSRIVHILEKTWR